MINTHCANDPIFGYCKSKPDYDIQPTLKEIKNEKNGGTVDSWYVGGHCKFDKKTCGNYIDHLEINGIENPKMVTTFKPAGHNTKKKDMKDKPMQGEMF